jgi:hypothetical protein
MGAGALPWQRAKQDPTSWSACDEPGAEASTPTEARMRCRSFSRVPVSCTSNRKMNCRSSWMSLRSSGNCRLPGHPRPSRPSRPSRPWIPCCHRWRFRRSPLSRSCHHCDWSCRQRRSHRLYLSQRCRRLTGAAATHCAARSSAASRCASGRPARGTSAHPAVDAAATATSARAGCAAVASGSTRASIATAGAEVCIERDPIEGHYNDLATVIGSGRNLVVLVHIGHGPRDVGGCPSSRTTLGRSILYHCVQVVLPS